MRPRNPEAVAVTEANPKHNPARGELWTLSDGNTVSVESVKFTEGKPDVYIVKVTTPADKNIKVGEEFERDFAEFQNRIGQAHPATAEAAPAKKGKAVKEKAVQTKLPGIQHPDDADMEKDVLEYVEARDQRMALNKVEKGLNEKLLAKLQALGKTELAVDGHIVRIVAKDPRVKVTTKADEAEESEDGNEDEE